MIMNIIIIRGLMSNIQHAPAGETPHIRARGLWYSYPQNPVLRGINLDITHGKVTALHGPNGCGKSTLLDLLSGLKKPQTGHLTLPQQRPAYVPQRTTIDSQLPLTVHQVVAMGTWTHRRLWKPLRKRDHQHIHHAMQKLHIDHLAKRRLDELSGGQLQRALLARALVTQAPLLLLDEPTTGVDTEARHIITTTLAEYAATGALVLHATHDQTAIDASDTVLHLTSGHINSPKITTTTS